jgi:uncharacterized membrane protein
MDRHRLLAPDDVAAIEARIRALEAHTGAQVVVVALERSDRFHGLRWRAYALASAVAAIAVTVCDLARPAWVTAHTAIVAAAIVVGAGLVAALAASCLPAFARLFLQHSRAHAAVNARARALFLERDCAATPRRNAVLLIASRYERVAAVLADTGYRGRIADADWQPVVDATTAAMAHGGLCDALIAGLDALEALLVARGFTAGGDDGNALPDEPIVIEDAP